MSQPENKPKLSDIAHQTNTDKADKAKRFSSTMIPAPPLPKQATPPVTESITPASVDPVIDTSAPATLADKIQQGEADFAQGKGTVMSSDEVKALSNPVESVPVEKSASAPTKVTRPRRSGPFVIDDVISGEPPKGETYPHQMRVAAHHHKLLRKLAFTHEVTMNHVLYNLLDLLDQADQREQQKGD